MLTFAAEPSTPTAASRRANSAAANSSQTAPSPGDQRLVIKVSEARYPVLGTEVFGHP